jgi:class 3 adenylate cyclase
MVGFRSLRVEGGHRVCGFDGSRTQFDWSDDLDVGSPQREDAARLPLPHAQEGCCMCRTGTARACAQGVAFGPMVRPTGIVTFLFTDIENSTPRWESDREGMRSALAVHDDVLRAAIEAEGGWCFKHTGDGVCAAFASPHAAIDAAISAQRSLELPVRMGIATGDAEQRGDDYFGPVLNRTARVMAAGHGGQILVAASTATLIDDLDCLDLGERRLRGLSATVPIFQVRAEGLSVEFPPLRTMDTLPGNLPAQAKTFVGRETQIAAVCDELGAHRLVTLVGVGGVGKTSLALRAAAAISADYRDGAWLVELAPILDAADLNEAVASAFAVAPAGRAWLDGLIDSLSSRQLLLVLDNCEHVLDAAALLAEGHRVASSLLREQAGLRRGCALALRTADPARARCTRGRYRNRARGANDPDG